MSLASFTQELDRLVSNFDRNKAFHSSKDFQESQLRVDFVSPLFEALGWDVSNRAGNPPHLREVVVESRVEEKGHRRRADYTFQVSGQPRLVVETKRPSEDLEDPKHILQLKKYAWNLQVRFAVLTNFLQTKIYAVPAPPVFTQPNEFLLEQVEFLQYLAKPDLLYGLLSKERVLEGALDKYFETIPKHKRDKAYQRSLFRLRGSKMVDDHFLDDLMEFRRDLARDIVQRNSRAGLTEPEVNEAVQRVIDRIVFLRIGEDRGIIYDPTLLDLVEKWGSKGSRVSFYPRLVEHFAGFNRPYNGLLFKPHSLSEGLDLSDEVLAGFIERISVETSPYRFDVIPVEILGSIYERFLGSVVRITPARVKVEEKPEVRKAGGVYYTPKYIVDYIVDQTVGKLLEGRTPEQVAEIRVLDPACGSGSFLLGAFTRIMEYLVEWFHRTPKASGKYGEWFYLDETGSVRLTPYAKRHILLNNLFGVDIDPQACEVTQLSLYLKLLEGESAASLREHQAKGHAEAFLPDLRNNVKCGNSLIGTEFEEDEQMSLLEGKVRKRVNVFDWQVEFPKIMKGGGFNAVIGNPPYGASFTENVKTHLFSKYPILKGQPESYEYFLLTSLYLCCKTGFVSFIVPTNFIESQRAEGLRTTFLDSGHVRLISNFRYNVWPKNAAETLVIVYQKGMKGRSTRVVHPRSPDEFVREDNSIKIDQADWELTPGKRFLIRADARLISKIEKDKTQLGDLCDLTQGIIVYKTRQDSAKNLYISNSSKGSGWKKLLDTNSSVIRYGLTWGNMYLKYGNWLWCPRDSKYFESPKILFVRLRNRLLSRKLIGTYDEEKYYNRDNFNNIIAKDLRYSLKYILGLFNSLLLNYWYKAYFDNVNINPAQVRLIPIRPIDFSKRSDKAKHDKMVRLVERMLELHKELSKAKSDHDKTLLQRQISSTDRQINSLVYDLYGLTKDEIKLVEESSS